jgi:phosphoglycerate dehydrogenase-like enzyme
MTERVGINGFGRIGRQVLKAIRDPRHPVCDWRGQSHFIGYPEPQGQVR